MPTFTSDQLTEVSKNLLRAAGASDEEAEIVTGHIVRSSLVGVDSHGILQLVPYIKGIRNGVIKAGAKVEVARESASTLLINGNWGFGQVTCYKTMKLAIEKASKSGIAAVCAYNCNHIGRLGHYTEMAADSDMIGFICVNGDPTMAPYGSRKRVFNTNPISYGIPAGNEKPIIVDFATSVAAEGKIRAALFKGQQLPSGWIIDSQGRATTNPADLYEPPLPPQQVKLAGAVLPFGGHKGSGLGLVVGVMSGILSGTGCDNEIKSGLTNGVYINVLKIDEFRPIEEFKREVDRLITTIRNCPTAEGYSEVLIPGDVERRAEEKRSKSGIDVPDMTWQSIVDTCKLYNLDANELVH